MSGYTLIWREAPSTKPPTSEELAAGWWRSSAYAARVAARRAAALRPGEVPYVVGPKGGIERVALESAR